MIRLGASLVLIAILAVAASPADAHLTSLRLSDDNTNVTSSMQGEEFQDDIIEVRRGFRTYRPPYRPPPRVNRTAPRQRATPRPSRQIKPLVPRSMPKAAPIRPIQPKALGKTTAKPVKPAIKAPASIKPKGAIRNPAIAKLPPKLLPRQKIGGRSLKALGPARGHFKSLRGNRGLPRSAISSKKLPPKIGTPRAENRSLAAARQGSTKVGLSARGKGSSNRVGHTRKPGVQSTGKAQLKLEASKKPIIIGENMKRVNEYAKKVGGHAYRPWKNNQYNLGMKRNENWIRDQMRQGRKVIDIGPDFQRRATGYGRSKFYEMERKKLKGYGNYSKAFERKGQEGGVRDLDF